jgi:hypothetical protein
LSLENYPPELKELHSKQDQLIPGDDSDIVIDSNFYGLTPLNSLAREIAADVVAVTGLAGHAFGSWKNRTSKRMWLRDFLSKDIPNLRVMTYGYKSNLVGDITDDFQTLLDYTKDLIHALETVRRSDEVFYYSQWPFR